MTIPIKSFAHKKMSLSKIGQQISKKAQIIKRFDMPILAQIVAKSKRRKK